jgi:hypothetical protein
MTSRTHTYYSYQLTLTQNQTPLPILLRLLDKAYFPMKLLSLGPEARGYLLMEVLSILLFIKHISPICHFKSDKFYTVYNYIVKK